MRTFGIANEFQHGAVVLRDGVKGLRRRRACAGFPTGAKLLEQFHIRQIGNGAAGGEKTVADANAGMIQEMGFDLNCAHAEIHFFEFVNGDGAGAFAAW